MVIFEVITSLESQAGAETLFYSLVKELSARPDTEIHCVVFAHGLATAFEDLPTFPRVRLHFIEKKKSLDFHAASSFRKLIKELNPDVVHSHLRCTVTFFLAFCFHRIRFRYFHTLHNVPKGEATLVDRFFKRLLLLRKNAVTYVAISDDLGAMYRSFYHTSRITVIPNGIVLRDVLPAAKKYDFIIVARFRPAKDHALLMRAFRKVHDVFPDARLCCVGDGETYEVTMALSRQLGIDGSVDFVGAQSDPYPFLSQSKIFVLSSHFEGTPVSIVEAMSAGLGLVLPRVGGIPNMVGESNAVLYETSSFEGLSCAMIELLSHPQRLSEQSAENIQASRRFSIAECCDRYLRLFENE